MVATGCTLVVPELINGHCYQVLPFGITVTPPMGWEIVSKVEK